MSARNSSTSTERLSKSYPSLSLSNKLWPFLSFSLQRETFYWILRTFNYYHINSKNKGNIGLLFKLYTSFTTLNYRIPFLYYASYHYTHTSVIHVFREHFYKTTFNGFLLISTYPEMSVITRYQCMLRVLLFLGFYINTWLFCYKLIYFLHRYGKTVKIYNYYYVSNTLQDVHYYYTRCFSRQDPCP